MNQIVRILLAAALVGAIGCDKRVKEKQIEVKAQADPLGDVRTLLTNYANGQPMTSEVTSFPKLVADVREVDPTKAEILEKGLEEIQKSNANARPSKAKELLQKLK